MNGFDDTVEDMYNYLVAMTPNPDLEKIRLYCEHSLEHFDWLESQGIVPVHNRTDNQLGPRSRETLFRNGFPRGNR